MYIHDCELVDSIPVEYACMNLDFSNRFVLSMARCLSIVNSQFSYAPGKATTNPQQAQTFEPHVSLNYNVHADGSLVWGGIDISYKECKDHQKVSAHSLILQYYLYILGLEPTPP